jgi:phage gpG-like protein
VRVSIEVLGDKVVERELLRFGARATDLSPAFDTILDQFEEWETHQFETEGAFLGTPWEPLAPSTITRKTALGQPLDILVATGELRASLTGRGRDAVRESRHDEATFGTRVPYAMYHHSREPRSRLPRRPLIAVDEVRRRWIIRVLQRFIVEGERRAA